MITSHLLPDSAFTELAEGIDTLATSRLLRDAQLSKHLMLVHAIGETAHGGGRREVAFRAGYDLLARIQAADPGATAWLLGLPHLGGWAHDCLIRLEQGTAADYGHLACLAAAAAIRAGIPFQIEVPLCAGRIRLPGLGSLRVAEPSAWIQLSCDGDHVAAGSQLQLERRMFTPDYGSGPTIPQWSGTPAVQAVSAGLAWSVLLEAGDPYLDRYTLPTATELTREELQDWRQHVQAAWDLLVRHHGWAAESVSRGIFAIVPLTARSDTDLVSATTPAAFGAIATSPPPDAVTLAETLVHEYQHVKLCGLLDMVELIRPGGEKVYAPWRQDPRPAGGLLQGVYAHLGIARFWQAQQHAETDPDAILRAQVLLARWAPVIDSVVQTLLDTGCLTPDGERFVGLLRPQGADLASGTVPAEAEEIAKEVALDHRLTWQMRHGTADDADIEALATAYQRGAHGQGRVLPRIRICEDARKVGSDSRSRLLNMRYLAPGRFRELCVDEALLLSEPDRLLVRTRGYAAVHAYRDQITSSAEPDPDAWIGLALAIHRLPASPMARVFADHLALMFDVHTRLGGYIDPLKLAEWFA